ncbi:hypothetical protein M655_024735 [Brevibacillus sp. NSP2.1]|uniref:hypothetical protein n=1 Tax=Brevibacillus sp. NSP2.1 TaxID=3003229 RepID=UPI00040B64EB|nr:hypothetical protein [Brevibacillus sp. NSP2.1]QHZ58582.1 hypothetical protein M655_024735 [Brevibacillus sp. NSP2.1]
MKTFLNDKDGVSEKDYLLLVSTTVFFLFVAIGLVLVLMGRPVDGMYVTLLDMVAPVLMTITGGVFGVRAVQEFRKKKSDTAEEEAEDYDARV